MINEAKITHKFMMPEGMYLQLFVPMSSQELFKQKETDQCEIIFAEDNSITSLQRKRIYATLHDAATFLGYEDKEIKDIFKYNFMKLKNIPEFSLKDCSKDIASDFIDYILEQCFLLNIPLEEEYGINRAYNITNYLKLCLRYRRCCICGRKADLHHDDAIGMGANRNHVDDSNKRKMALCREHHTERHKIGEINFNKKYHVYGVLFSDAESTFWNIVNSDEEEDYEN